MCPTCDRTCDYWRLSGSCLYSQLTYFFDNYSTIILALITSAWANILMVCHLKVSCTTLAILGYLWVGVLISVIDSHYYCICLLVIYAQQTFLSLKPFIVLFRKFSLSVYANILVNVSQKFRCQSYLLYLYLAGTCNLNIQDNNITNLKNFPSLVLV